MTLHAPGTAVCIGPGHETPAVVLAVTVRGDARHVTYEVAWWDGSVRRSEWLQAHEVVAERPALHIGFRPD